MNGLEVTAIPEALRSATDPLLARIEDAALTASQPREQAFHDGWLLRYANGKAKRARSVNLVAAGRLPLEDKLDYCAAFYARQRLPLLVRVTPFSQPSGVDDALARAGLVAFEETRVMVRELDARIAADVPPVDVVELDAARFGATLAQLHGLDAQRGAVERDRFARSAVDGIYLAVRQGDALVSCGSVALDGGLAGIFGMVTLPSQRGRGLGGALLAQLLSRARGRGCTTAYLQVDASNAPARRTYAKFGFADRYAYWYRTPPKEKQEC